MGSRQTFTDRRRRQLALTIDRLDQLEGRSMITESLGVFTAGIGVPAAAMAHAHARASEQARGGAPAHHVLPISATPPQAPRRHQAAPGGIRPVLAALAARRAQEAGDWLVLARRARADDAPFGAGADEMRRALKAAAARGAGGGAQSRGGAPGGSPRGAIAPLRLPAPNSAAPASGIGALGASVSASAGSPHAGTATASRLAAAATAPAPAGTQTVVAGAATTTPTSTSTGTISGGGISPSSGPYLVSANGSGAALGQFTYWPLYVVDYNHGVTLLPGANQIGYAAGQVDLRAQVSGASGVTFSWDTTHLGSANSITGTSTYRLQFTWGSSIPNNTTSSVTLTATDSLGHQESQTYTFELPSGSSGAGSGGGVSWPQSLAPNTVLASDAAIASHYASVDSNSGALDTSIALPAYNPNVPALSLNYDSLTADARPIIVVPHTLDPTQAVPTKVSGQLTFNGTGGTT